MTATDRNLGPQQCKRLLIAVGSCELQAARELAKELPVQRSFENKTALGLAIGGCGRRMRALFDAADSIDDQMIQSAVIRSGRSRRHRLAACYSAGLALCEPLGMRAFAFQKKLEDGLADLKRLRVTLRLSGSGSSPRTHLTALLHDVPTGGRHMRRTRPHRARRGPPRSQHDPRWTHARVGEPLPRMKRLESKAGLLHKLHHTAFRETLAAEVAALNLLEYDGLPWRFYVDMARQVEDEARHAAMAAESLYEHGGRFGQVLLPPFGNYYSLFFDMSLHERLVAMNLETEGPGCAYLRNAANRMKLRGHPDIASLFEFVEDDERRHANYGARWLQYLFPDLQQRQEAVDETRALLAIRVASMYAESTASTVFAVVDQWLSNGARPLLFSESADPTKHEREVPLLRRRGARRI